MTTASDIGEEGRLVAGRYRLQRRIGGGAMGVVWQAHDAMLDRVVAVKQLRELPGRSVEQTEQARQRAFREGRIAARMQHANAITVYDVADDRGTPALVMEYLPSRSLAEVLTERGTLTPVEAARIGEQAASAMAAAHAAGIVHRDLKPGNILLGTDGTTKITDFGISRAVGDVAVTQTGQFAGTPAFLSPESARGEEPGPASDVFSLGATLFAAVEGGPPFGPTDNPIALLYAVAAGQPRRAVRAGVLTPWLDAMMAADPVARPTMTELVAGLRAAASGRQVSPPATPMAAAAMPPSPTGTKLDLAASPGDASAPAAGQPRETAGRNRMPLLYGALAMVVLIAAGAAAFLLRDGDGQRPAGANPAPKPTSVGAPPPSSPPPSATPSSSSPTSPSPSSSKTPDAAQMQRVVAQYYSALPSGLDSAWKLLGPGLQAQGRKSYDAFWGKVKDLRVVTQPKAAGTNVDVGIDFTVEGRGRFRETHRLGMTPSGGNVVINSDQVVSSKQVKGKKDGGDKPSKDDDK